MLVLGFIESPFMGIGAGMEMGLGAHISLSFDVNWSANKEGSVTEFRPSVNYYFKTLQSGFFLGPAFKLFILDDDNEMWEHKFYNIGLNIGYKVMLQEDWTLGLTACPHFGFGPTGSSRTPGISAQLGLGYRF